jgi:hypothetical protein
MQCSGEVGGVIVRPSAEGASRSSCCLVEGETGRSDDRVDPSAAAWVEQVGRDDVGDVGLVDG